MSRRWWPWCHRPDPDVIERAKREAGRMLSDSAAHHAEEVAKTEAVRKWAEAVKGHAELAKRRTEWEIRENHLGERLKRALREMDE